MKFYPEDFTVEVVVGFTGLNGEVVTPTAISAVLYDGEDQVIVDFGSLPFVPTEGAKSIMIPAQFNALEADELRAPRILRVELTTAGGVIRRSHSYVIEVEQRLEIMTNTFLSYEAAELAALDIPGTSGWAVASEEQRKAALVEAFRRLTMIPMKYTVRDALGELTSEEVRIARDQWADLTYADMTTLPSHFRKAIRRAQVIEANELLQGDAIAKKRRSGIITETIGESSVTLSTGRADYGVSSQTMAALAGYIYFGMRIARA